MIIQSQIICSPEACFVNNLRVGTVDVQKRGVPVQVLYFHRYRQLYRDKPTSTLTSPPAEDQQCALVTSTSTLLSNTTHTQKRTATSTTQVPIRTKSILILFASI